MLIVNQNRKLCQATNVTVHRDNRWTRVLVEQYPLRGHSFHNINIWLEDHRKESLDKFFMLIQAAGNLGVHQEQDSYIISVVTVGCA